MKNPKNYLKHAPAALCLALLCMLAAFPARQALAYFTTYATATGSAPFYMRDVETEIDEAFYDMTKDIQIVNTGEEAAYVRVRVYTGSAFSIDYTPSENWRQEGGYWYYDSVLQPGERTSSLKAKIALPEGANTEDGIAVETFDVIVIDEFVPASYDSDGKPYADWDLRAPDYVKKGGAA